MTQRRLGQIDLDTGEIFDGYQLVAVPNKRRHGFGKEWFSMVQDPTDWLASGNLTQTQMRVLFALFNRLDYENYIHIDQSAVADKIGMDRTHFAKALKRLIELDMVRKGPKVGRTLTYRFNPTYAWKGTSENHKKALTDELRDRIKRAGITGVIEGGAQPAKPAEQPFR